MQQESLRFCGCISKQVATISICEDCSLRLWQNIDIFLYAV